VNSKPQPDELEVSIFGSHFGECIVVHLPNGKWMIVDSCITPETKEPIALSYLNKIGVNISNDVQLIVITHWHDDHIKGISRLVSACHSASVCFSAAMVRKEFLTLMAGFSGEYSLVPDHTSGTKEMANTIKELKNRISSRSTGSNYMTPVIAGRILLEDSTDSITIRSLSPSDKSYHQAIACFSSLIPRDNAERITLPSPKENHLSIVLWVSCNNATVLLGSDLEEVDDEETGWRAIINSSVRPEGKAHLFKIPHHGSKTGHSDDVWNMMVEEDPLCLVTENTRGSYSIPTPEDIARIKNYSSKLFSTSAPRQKLMKRNNTVEKTLREMVKSRRSLGGDLGQIQVRITPDGNTIVNAKEPATQL